ncbi:unnamed protein product [Bursaphelenchus xylophilus]|uniref:(pine wood nematode) hypothetical protein n=1 Tax=Bursaphelenchus xylophilus TaxID=6326 RepID=A0A1I7RPE9_BURXY|nr:unnamed protein product [Bursaphelenchus xylophilus]CAG9095911.1 unnamed protein product [Bursaphelenchus xylophilus]
MIAAECQLKMSEKCILYKRMSVTDGVEVLWKSRFILSVSCVETKSTIQGEGPSENCKQLIHQEYRGHQGHF